jgi:hypothetical protein
MAWSFEAAAAAHLACAPRRNRHSLPRHAPLEAAAIVRSIASQGVGLRLAGSARRDRLGRLCGVELSGSPAPRAIFDNQPGGRSILVDRR